MIRGRKGCQALKTQDFQKLPITDFVSKQTQASHKRRALP